MGILMLSLALPTSYGRVGEAGGLRSGLETSKPSNCHLILSMFENASGSCAQRKIGAVAPSFQCSCVWAASTSGSSGREKNFDSCLLNSLFVACDEHNFFFLLRKKNLLQHVDNIVNNNVDNMLLTFFSVWKKIIHNIVEQQC